MLLSFTVPFCVPLLLLSPQVNHSKAAEDSLDVVLRFGGDVLLGGYYEAAAKDSAALAFSGFDLLKNADLAMVNLENPVTTRGTKVAKPYNFRMHPRFLDALKVAGIDVVTLANNHIFDYGSQGLFDTISYLDSLGIEHVGAGRTSAEAHRPVRRTIKGHTIGLLGYYGGGEAPAAHGKKSGVASREISRIAEDIQQIRESDSAAYIAVNLHWGTEKATTPDSDQREFARQVIDAGANAVIGHHPHVLQGIEQYKYGVIAYSLGNFIFGGNSRDSYDTGVLEIRLSRGKPSYRFIPVGVRGWRASELTGHEAERVLMLMKRLSQSFSHTIFKQ